KARRAPADPGRRLRERTWRTAERASARTWPGLAWRALSCQPRRAAGGCAARARCALRRPDLKLVAAGLFLHHSTDETDPCRHRTERDRAQLPGRTRP